MADGGSFSSPEDAGATNSQPGFELPDWAENSRRRDANSKPTRNNTLPQPQADFDDSIAEAPDNNTGAISPSNDDRVEKIQSTVNQRKISTGQDLRQKETGLELSEQAEGPSESNLPIRGQNGPTQSSDQGSQIHSLGPKASNDLRYDPIDSYDEEPELQRQGYPRLTFRPIQLRTWYLLGALGFFSLCAAAIASLIEWNRRHKHISSSRAHLALRYTPAVVGTVTTIWWGAIFSALTRFTPYFSMAAKKKASSGYRSRGNGDPQVLHTNYGQIGNIEDFIHNRHWLLSIGGVITIITVILLVPLKAAFVQVTPGDSGWEIVISPKIGFSLITIYALLTLYTLTILVALWDRETGLKWDPTSVMDQLALVRDSNILPIFDGLEIYNYNGFQRMFRQRISRFDSVRLAYWKPSDGGPIWHGIRLVPKPTELSPVAPAQRNDRTSIRGDGESSRTSTNEPSISSSDLDRDLAFARYREVYILLSDTALSIYALMGLVVFIATTFGITHHLLDVTIGSPVALCKPFTCSLSESISSAEEVFSVEVAFFYRFFPSEVFALFSNLWIVADAFYRSTEPFAGMDKAMPATSNLLLDYPSSMAIAITYKAVSNGHWRVAIFSLYSLLATAPPIVAAGIFISTPNQTSYKITIQPVNFWFCYTVLILNLLSIPLARPSIAYRLPRAIRNFADILSYCYASHTFDDTVLNEPVFSAQAPTDERVHLVSKVQLAKRRYRFGVYKDREGGKHLGFDIDSQREGPSGLEDTVSSVRPGRAIYSGFFSPWYYRNPEITRKTV